MKHFTFILFLSIISLTSCSINSDNEESNIPTIIGEEYHLINVFGGVSGVNNTYEVNDIIWMFDAESGELTIDNNNTDDTIEDGLDSGIYNFSVTDQNSTSFLFINGSEFANLIFSAVDNELILDQNITIDGSGADGYIYEFKRFLIYED